VPLAAGAELVAAIVLLLFGEVAHHTLFGFCLASKSSPRLAALSWSSKHLASCYCAAWLSIALTHSTQAACSFRAASSQSAPSIPPGAHCFTRPRSCCKAAWLRLHIRRHHHLH
jgi:hypothetical protein